jgi:predicted TIM-barrel fold metal-dependent hydrolase
MADDLLISADTHLGEPLDLWSTRLPESLRERAVWAHHIGGDRYLELHHPGGGRHAAQRYLHIDGSMMEYIGGGSAEQTLADLQGDGVWGAVVFPNGGLVGSFGPDHELALAHAQIYNDYVSESYARYRDRFALAAPIPLTDVSDAVAEVERVAGMGFRAILVPVMPPRPYAGKLYDPVWAAARANGLQVTMHLATGFQTDNQGNPIDNGFSMMGTGAESSPDDQQDDSAEAARLAIMSTAGTAGANRDLDPVARRLIEQEAGADTAKHALMSLIGAGVLDRFPSLHFAFIEFNANWLPGVVAAMDKACRVGIGQDTE